jgi:hypothetical protein
VAKIGSHALEEHLPTTADQAARTTASPHLSLGLSLSAADSDDANADPVTDTQPNAVATRATDHWTTDEDAQLTSAVTNIRKKKYGKDRRTDWKAVAAMAPGRTRKKCFDRCTNGFASSIDGTARRTGKWTSVKDSKLKDAVKTHGGKDWTAIAALVPGRAGNQCEHRWKGVLDPIGRANRRTGNRGDSVGSEFSHPSSEAHGRGRGDSITSYDSHTDTLSQLGRKYRTARAIPTGSMYR